jgi:redox-sensitive bicupin YhaK (pirin superfamily)
LSWQPAATPDEADAPASRAVEMVIVPRTRDLGGFEVRRVLPSAQRRMVGPFVFLDQMGPVEFAPGKGIDVRPHPHIGLATVTYLFEGAIVHRDSLGTTQTITPGAVNLMTAGRGIVHSERSAAEDRKRPNPMFGLQIWVALPEAKQEIAPAFAHHPVASLPTIEDPDKTVRIVVGTGYGATAPVATQSEMFLIDAQLKPGARLPVEAAHEERAAYVVGGAVEIDGQRFGPGQLLVLAPGAKPTVTAREAARLVLLGGEPMDGPRHLWWNFVSSSQERIEQAKADWKAGRFGTVPGDDKEFIPLPD